MTVTISYRVSDLKNQSTESDKIYNYLKRHKARAYTREGLMIMAFGIKQKEIDVPSGKWTKEHSNLYFRIVNALSALIKQDKIHAHTKKAPYKYWYKQ